MEIKEEEKEKQKENKMIYECNCLREFTNYSDYLTHARYCDLNTREY